MVKKLGLKRSVVSEDRATLRGLSSVEKRKGGGAEKEEEREQKSANLDGWGWGEVAAEGGRPCRDMEDK